MARSAPRPTGFHDESPLKKDAPCRSQVEIWFPRGEKLISMTPLSKISETKAEL